MRSGVRRGDGRDTGTGGGCGALVAEDADPRTSYEAQFRSQGLNRLESQLLGRAIS